MNYIPPEIIKRLQTLSSESVAERLGIQTFRHKAKCFMHNDHHPSLSFFGPNREHWKCFACDKGGRTAISLVMAFHQMDFKQACEWLSSQYAIYYSQTIYRKVNSPTSSLVKNIAIEPYREDKPFCKEIAEWIIKHASLSDHAKKFLFEERRLSPRVITELKIRSITNSHALVTCLTNNFDIQALLESGLVNQSNGRLHLRLFVPCLIFPYYDVNGNLVGLQSRYLGDQPDAPRFQFVSQHKSRLFNLRIVHKLNKGDDVYISEGITDCLALLSTGYNALALPSATILPKDDLRELKRFKIYMYPDSDKAGKNAFYELRDILINMGANIQMKELPYGFKDFGDYYKQQHE